jgi:hypothetical protein
MTDEMALSSIAPHAQLDKHGRCSTCQSDAVVSAYAHKPQAFPINQFDEIRELERIAQLL